MRPDLRDEVTIPDVLMQAHSAPLQIVFYEGEGFPPEYRGSAFVTMRGSWNRGEIRESCPCLDSEINSERSWRDISVASATRGDAKPIMEILNIVADLVPIEPEMTCNHFAFRLAIIDPSHALQCRHDMQCTSICSSKHAVKKVSYLIDIQQDTHVGRGIPSHNVGGESC